MADYVEVGGARTWYDERGDGEPVVLLHGGFSDSRDFTGNLDALAEHFRVVIPDRRGHGRTPDVPGPISQRAMAQDTVAFIDRVLREPVRLVGYSDGAVVALLVALIRPDLVGRLVLISGVYERGGWIAQPDADAVANMPEEIVSAYAEVSPDGREHFPVVAAKLAAMSSEELGITTGELGAIRCPVLVLAADDDFITLEHTLALYRGVPGAQLAVVPGTSHALLDEKPALCTRLVESFLATDAVPTMLPVRRAEA